MGIRLSANEATKLGVLLASRFKELGMTQLEIEAATNVDQTQVSRIFAGDFTFVSTKVEALCKKCDLEYAKNGVPDLHDWAPPADSHKPPRRRAEEIEPNALLVLQAFESVWDGSPRHAVAIGDLIRAAGPLVQGSR